MTGMIAPIWVSLGKKRYVGGTITENTGKDISGATFTIALGADYTTPPTVFVTPTVTAQGATTADRVLKLLINTTTTPGTYYVWGNIVDNPEIEPMVLQGPITVS